MQFPVNSPRYTVEIPYSVYGERSAEYREITARGVFRLYVFFLLGASYNFVE